MSMSHSQNHKLNITPPTHLLVGLEKVEDIPDVGVCCDDVSVMEEDAKVEEKPVDHWVVISGVENSVEAGVEGRYDDWNCDEYAVEVWIVSVDCWVVISGVDIFVDNWVVIIGVEISMVLGLDSNIVDGGKVVYCEVDLSFVDIVFVVNFVVILTVDVSDVTKVDFVIVTVESVDDFSEEPTKNNMKTK